MRPLAPDDLIPFEEYAARRAEFLAAHVCYCDSLPATFRLARVLHCCLKIAKHSGFMSKKCCAWRV